MIGQLFLGDRLMVMSSLLPALKGKVALAYLDPPFMSQQHLSYEDVWDSAAAYLCWLRETLVLANDLLSDSGTIFVQIDWRIGYRVRVLLDEVFGVNHFLNEIIWWHYNKLYGAAKVFGRNHDTIFWYRKGRTYTFVPQSEKRKEPTKRNQKVWDSERAKYVNRKGADGKPLYYVSTTRKLDDVWRIPLLPPANKKENILEFRTQKPEALLERIIGCASVEGDLILDPFVGSGTTAVVAARLGRSWIGIDDSPFSIRVSKERLRVLP